MVFYMPARVVLAQCGASTMNTHALITEKQVIELTCVSRSTIRRWINNPRVNFPAFVKIGPNSIRWKISDVLAFIERQAGDKA